MDMHTHMECACAHHICQSTFNCAKGRHCHCTWGRTGRGTVLDAHGQAHGCRGFQITKKL
eukprot:3848591-Alexandrium_andersonii.AAC.1